ncbi:MAG: hypothetical protein AAFQ80_20130 [Cyanobacteria bacterium J06621_8]
MIIHTIKSYPSEIIFGGFEDVAKICIKIYSTGFLPHGRLEDIVIRTSTPFRKATLEISVFIYIAVTIGIFISLASGSLIDSINYIPGILETPSLLIILLKLLATRFIATLQKLIIKPDHIGYFINYFNLF